MKPFTRSERVAGLIQKVLAEVLQKDIQDPRLAMTSITGVEMSADLRHARIYFVTSGDARRRQDAAKGFKTALGYLKRALAQELDLRYMPELKFFYDESYDYGSRIDAVLRSLKTEDEKDRTAAEK